MPEEHDEERAGDGIDALETNEQDSSATPDATEEAHEEPDPCLKGIHHGCDRARRPPPAIPNRHPGDGANDDEPGRAAEAPGRRHRPRPRCRRPAPRRAALAEDRVNPEAAIENRCSLPSEQLRHLVKACAGDWEWADRALTAARGDVARALGGRRAPPRPRSTIRGLAPPGRPTAGSPPP